MDNEIVVAIYDRFKKIADENTIEQIAKNLSCSAEWQIVRMSDYSIVLELKDFSVNGEKIHLRVHITKGLSNHVLVKWNKGE